MAKLSNRDGLKEKETRVEIVARLKEKKAGGEKLTWKERWQLHVVKIAMVLGFGIPFTVVALAVLNYLGVIKIF